jgi:hypothetical protein
MSRLKEEHVRGLAVGRTAAWVSALLVIVGAHTLLANPYFEYIGFLSTGSHVVAVDSMTVLDRSGGIVCRRTAGWGGDTGVVDTFSYQSESLLTPIVVTFFLLQDDSALVFGIPNFTVDSWYIIPGSPREAEVMFSGFAGLEEDRHRMSGRAGLTVSPSVVTGQMTLRVQPVATGRPVVQIHDAAGNVIRSLGCTAGADGVATATWNREDDRGRLIPEGVYFCRCSGADVIATRKVLVAH